MPRLSASLWLTLLPPMAALAQPLPNAVPPNAVNRATSDAFAQCRQAGGQPDIRAGYLTNFELTSDNRVDVILDMAKLDCTGGTGAPSFCGPAGCLIRVFVSTAQGPQLAMEILVLRWSAAIEARRPVLTLSLPAAQCGPAATGPCERKLVWAGQGFADQRTGEAFAPKS